MIDTHAHLDFPQLYKDLPEVIQRAKKAGISKIIEIGCSGKRAKKAISIAEKYENVFACIGIHPNDVKEDFDREFQIIKKLASHKKVVAIGECGFDFFYPENATEEKQAYALQQHFLLAEKLNLPLVLHFREAQKQAINFLKKNKPKNFVVHCFSSDLTFAKEIIALKGLISLTGIITFPKAEILRKVVKEIPLSKIMLETDCPFLAPGKFRGKVNEPAFVIEIAKKIAEIKGVSLQNVDEVTTKNAERFFLSR